MKKLINILLLAVFMFAASGAEGAVWPFKGKGKELLEQARREYSERRYEEAVVTIEKFLQKSNVKRREKRGYLLLGQSYEQLGMWNKALNAYLEGVELNPKDMSLYLHLANLYRKTGLTTRAIEIYSYVQEKNKYKYRDEILLGLAKAYKDEGFFSKSIDNYKEYFDGDLGKDDAALFEYAIVYLGHKMYNEALFLTGILIQKDADNPGYWFLSSKIKKAQGKKREACDDLDEAIRLNPDDETLAFVKVLWLIGDNRIQEAKEHLDAIILEDNAPLTLFSKYLIAEKQGKKKEALKYLKQIVEQNNGGFIHNISNQLLLSSSK
ncbi:Tetratricopeptide repeat-containing protein [Parelusimicrobium proximum]|uniref:tetratricopeptide repeat protein n=1 Tax=Parelusimicrobium proximum TaxID=3228953 RepID=UPI003D16A1FF